MPAKLGELLARDRSAPCGAILTLNRSQLELVMEALELRLQAGGAGPREGQVTPMREDWLEETHELYWQLDSIRNSRPGARYGQLVKQKIVGPFE